MRCALPAAHDKDCVNDFATAKLRTECPPNLLAHYLYLWELTGVRQAVETAWISGSVTSTILGKQRLAAAVVSQEIAWP